MTDRRRLIFKTIAKKDANISYTDRSAVRAILCDPKTNEIALMHIVKGNYYQLPGGGVEGAKDHKSVVLCEILEETGCKASIQGDGYLATSVANLDGGHGGSQR